MRPAAEVDEARHGRAPTVGIGGAVAKERERVTGSVVGFIDGCGTGKQRGLCTPSLEGQKAAWYGVDFQYESSGAKTVKFGEFTGRTLSTGTSGIRPEIAPRYIIEVIPDPTPGSNASTKPTLYRVTAMGFGPRKSTQAVAQMIFRKE